MTNILEKIYTSSLHFLAPMYLEETYKHIVDEAIALINADYGSIVLEKNGEWNRVYASIDLAYNTTNRSKGNTYKAFVEQKPRIVPVTAISQFHPELEEYGIKTTVFIPLSYAHKSIGVLIINSHDEITYNSKELHALTLFGSMASLAIEKARLHQETKEALDQRDLFISLASHELRTPLTSIYMYIQLMKSKLEKGEEIKLDWAVMLQRETNRLINLVNEFLQTDQIKSGKLGYVMNETSVKEVVNQAVTNFLLTHPERKITLDDSVATNQDIIIGDADKLMQVVINLLSNSAKFSSKESPISLSVASLGSQVTIKVKDEGDGISKEDLEHIFEGFYRGKLTGAKGGMGLGLYLTKNIIDKHKGHIQVQSEIGKGTTFDISLPKVQSS